MICINNESNPASLILGKVYRTLPDASAEARGMIRVADEDKSEPDGYLYPLSMFAPIELPEAAEETLMRSHEQTAWMARRTVCGNCWLVYFDILGFKNILRNHYAIKTAGLDAFAKFHYRDILGELRRVGKYSPDDVTAIWFSDTFLLFAHDDSHKSLVSINQAATHFFEEVISQRWALRGALGIGEFYADLNDGVFLGQALVDAYRKIVPGAALSTDIIIGFPTESDADFEATHSLIKDVLFDSAYIFKYSPRPHASASALPDDVSKEEKERRHAIILSLQKEISKKKKGV